MQPKWSGFLFAQQIFDKEACQIRLKGSGAMKKIVDTLIFSLLAALAMLSQYIADPNFDSDILWSVAIGKWIDLNHSFPVVDSFSWTINGKEWMTHEWAYSFLAYKFNHLFGSLGIYIITLIPIVLTIYFLYLMATRYDENKSYAYILVFTIGVVLLYLLALPFRAYIYALLFITLLIYLLYFKDEGNLDYILYALLFMLWANFQVSVFIGLVVLVAEMTKQFVLYPPKRLRTLTITAICLVSTLVNPYGYKLWTYFVFVMSTMDVTKSSIAEWQAADFNEPWVLLIYVGTAVFMLFLQFNNAKKSAVGSIKAVNTVIEEPAQDEKRKIFEAYGNLIHWLKGFLTRENCLIIGYWIFYIYALYSVRMFVFSLIFWTINVCYFVGKSRRFHFKHSTYYLYLVLFVVMFLANWASADFMIKDIFTAKKDISPVDEVIFLKENPVYSQHLFNEYIFGGYLILNDIPVFIDARSDSYIKFGIQQKYMDITGLKEDPQVLLDELGVENLLITDGTLKKYIDINPKWKLVYGGPTAFIYSRTANNF